MSQARIKEEDLHLRPALNPLANKLWSPAHNDREELEPTDPVQGYDTISKWHWDKETTVKDGKEGMWTG